MPQQILNIGTNANDGTGDTLRDAMIKVNDNFTELYNSPLDQDGITSVSYTHLTLPTILLV